MKKEYDLSKLTEANSPLKEKASKQKGIDEKKQKSFYESIGYKNTKDSKEVPLNAYVKIKNTELK